MKIIKTCLLFILLGSMAGCDMIYRMLDKEGAEEKELVGEITPFEKNPTIEEGQVLLKIYGYNSGEPDGILGVRTRNSIEKFQKDNGLKETRFVDNETWQKLRVYVDIGLITESQLNIELIQNVLKKSGVDPGKIDGKFGAKTTKAVKTFQKMHGLKVDGKIGYQTLTKLASYIE